MKRILTLTALAAMGLVATGGASQVLAGSRYTSRPPVVLSPDLSEPWLLQLRPRRQAYRVAPPVEPRYQRRYDGRDDRYANQPRQPRPQYQRTSAVQSRPHVEKPRARAIDPQFLPTTVNYDGSYAPGTIVIDTNERYLYHVQSGGTARRYGVGVGRPGFEWAGTHTVTRKAEWPDWRPPAEMRQRQPSLPKHMPGGPQNPLGARALYLGSTLYRIHGSNQPWTIGHAVSSGCIRMRNEDVIELYKQVNVGAKVIVK